MRGQTWILQSESLGSTNSDLTRSSFVLGSPEAGVLVLFSFLVYTYPVEIFNFNFLLFPSSLFITATSAVNTAEDK